ncbi:MAG: amino acid-binding protein [Alphaproteobacteria bacterium]|nr:amino acid-binding protein [Alphaproteobacteria bacterium]MCL2504703.1 amino acid-binding protein [Alphaproteobacteria bacterium]
MKQLSVFLENSPGSLLRLTEALAQAEVNLRALTVSENADFGIVRILVHDIEHAASVVKAANFICSQTDVVAVEIPDRTGGLFSVLKEFENKGLNIEYMYSLQVRSKDKAVMIFRFKDTEKALNVIKNTKFVLFEEPL